MRQVPRLRWVQDADDSEALMSELPAAIEHRPLVVTEGWRVARLFWRCRSPISPWSW